MILLPAHNMAFVSTPRSGTHTMYKLLAEQFGGKRHGRFHENVIPQNAMTWRVWTTCRNPYTRAASSWQWGAVKSPSRKRILGEVGSPDFEAYCLWMAERPRTWYAAQPQTAWHDLFMPADVLHLETLEAELMERFGWSVTLPHECRSPYANGGLAENLTDRAADAIRRWAAADFERFGYSLDPPV